MINIKKKTVTCEKRILEGFEQQSAATVHEAMGRRGAVDPSIKPIVSGMRIFGTALTVSCHTGDNLMLIKAVSMAESGDVIVADMGSAVNSGPFGEVLAVECKVKGVNGLAVNCAVRDKHDVAALGFPVFSSGLCVFGTAKATLGTINLPISFGGQIVRPGDIIVGDDDGIVVVPLEEASEVLQLACERTAKEKVIMDRLRAGESLFDMYGYQKIFDTLNCIEEE